jgi:hypothetical protein
LLPFGKKAHKIMKTYYKISQWMLLARLLFWFPIIWTTNPHSKKCFHLH